MDKTTINNKAVKAVVKFESFWSSPHFTYGEHEEIFSYMHGLQNMKAILQHQTSLIFMK